MSAMRSASELLRGSVECVLLTVVCHPLLDGHRRLTQNDRTGHRHILTALLHFLVWKTQQPFRVHTADISPKECKWGFSDIRIRSLVRIRLDRMYVYIGTVP